MAFMCDVLRALVDTWARSIVWPVQRQKVEDLIPPGMRVMPDDERKEMLGDILSLFTQARAKHFVPVCLEYGKCKVMCCKASASNI